MPMSLTAVDVIGGHAPRAPVEEAGSRSHGKPGAEWVEGRGRYAKYLALRSEVRDLEESLEARRKAAHLHFLWAILGLSPAAFLPLVGLLRAGSLVLAVVLGVLLSTVEMYRGMKARGEFFATLEQHEQGKRRLRELGPF